MIHSEYTRSLNCNYQRILLEKKPEEKRYQYCILSRGGIRGLLSCDLRYINGDAYLYYDITSKQNLEHVHKAGSVTRAWLKDFLWSIRQIQQELGRFLLDTSNILWYPEQIFRDLETNEFCFLYIPYYEGESGFGKLMDFLAEHIDYSDEILVDCVYHMYEQQEKLGDDYLQNLIFEDTKCLDEILEPREAQVLNDTESLANTEKETENSQAFNGREEQCGLQERVEVERGDGKKGFFGFWETKRSRNKRQREEYRQQMHREMAGFAVAEELPYQGTFGGEQTNGNVGEENDDEEDYGRTIYVETLVEDRKVLHRLLTPEGTLLAVLDKPSLTMGKKKGEVDLAFEEASVSRLHARIILEDNRAYLEDLNSTNGTFKNGLRLQPYEKRRLDEGDEIQCGRVTFVFR